MDMNRLDCNQSHQNVGGTDQEMAMAMAQKFGDPRDHRCVSSSQPPSVLDKLPKACLQPGPSTGIAGCLGCKDNEASLKAPEEIDISPTFLN